MSSGKPRRASIPWWRHPNDAPFARQQRLGFVLIGARYLRDAAPDRRRRPSIAYLFVQHGVIQVWLIAPLERQVYVYDSITRVRILVEADVLDNTVVPGFTLELADWFQQATCGVRWLRRCPVSGP